MMPVCVIVGAGSKWSPTGKSTLNSNQGQPAHMDVPLAVKWGMGGAIALRFAREGYQIAMLSRDVENLKPIADAIETQEGQGRAYCFSCDVADEAAVQAAFRKVRDQCGDAEVLVYNAGYTSHGAGNVILEELETQLFDISWNVHTRGAFLCAKQCLPAMREQGKGTVLLTGVPAKAGKKSATISVQKSGLRALGQMISADYHPHGVHCAYVMIDGSVDTPGVRAMGFYKKHPEVVLDPEAIAHTYWQLHTQDKSIWSYEIQLSPFSRPISPRF